jgi:OmpA-OmpF porin, OOP family
MRNLGWMCAFLAVASFNAAANDHVMTAPVCTAGLSGSHAAGADADRDGVPDSEDWCPRSAPGTRIGHDGCAAGEVDVRCTGAPVAAAPRVVAAGVRDSDRDGVPDEDDRCPNTTRGVAVDSRGCADISRVVLKGVSFATGSATLKPEAHDTLRTVAAAMKANPKLKVEVGGHTDSVGEDARNQALSERRAQSVKDFLVKEGIEAGRLTTRGYGETQPVDTNDTAAGRANNRRVAFNVTAS